MRTQTSSLKSASAKRLLAPLNRKGWNVEITHGDGSFKRGGRNWQAVPWCKICATHSRKELPITAKVKDWNQERAELEAASHLLETIRRRSSKAPSH